MYIYVYINTGENINECYTIEKWKEIKKIILIDYLWFGVTLLFNRANENIFMEIKGIAFQKKNTILIYCPSQGYYFCD